MALRARLALVDLALAPSLDVTGARMGSLVELALLIRHCWGIGSRRSGSRKSFGV